ncbi:hypothetical protein AMATHDRAFT_55392 [Amanita thiersii Skay4041]|uniref:U2A'/phosphoprotein 32 family A C-terminal domain-containing protein n=1 Tax=Amanita thiersii Skay4041 TaxID=703135 RepID=A0A2A9NXA2_9AGAR|nr:hypothetical protein AMATHDRAFT_55392 [Amanita thiersii Skay4041]
MEHNQDISVTGESTRNDAGATVATEKQALCARVELPTQNADATAESDEDHVAADVDKEEEEDNGDFLEDFPDNTDDLELVHLRIGSLSHLRLPRFAQHLRRLCLRQNLISHLDAGIFHTLVNLEELDLYDNKVKYLGDALDKLPKLKSLDLSFNLFKNVPERLEHMPLLETIYFVQNRLTKISGLGSLVQLRSLELGGNKIRKIENLETLVNLEELWLGKNKLVKIEGLSTLKNLKILSLQSNRITKLEGLEGLENLDQLYLSHNGIKKIEGLESNSNLTTLDIGNNFVEVLENVSHLTQLTELWMNGNQIPDLRALDTQLRSISTLETLYLEGNPCQTSDMANYRRKVKLALPQLKQIDATYVKPT